MEMGTERHRKFMGKLLPTVDPERIVGVKMPILRQIAKELPREYVRELPHVYFEEDMLHDFVINSMNRDEALQALREFLPYLDNWAVVDSLDPKSFYSAPSLMDYYLEWSDDSRPYVARLGIVLALRHMKEDTLGAVDHLKTVKSDHYYVQMALACFLQKPCSTRRKSSFPF